MTSMSEVEGVEMRSDVGRGVDVDEDVSMEASESERGDMGDFIVIGIGEIGDSGDIDVVDIGESCVICVDTSCERGVDTSVSCNNARFEATSD